ncbi:Fe(2+) transporter permease subunit FeoB [Aurantivibrio infirmus]
MSFKIALVGNPNCGKTTLFNVLTGAHQKVGNWPGVTVERKTGTLSLAKQPIEIIDLPGIYNLDQSHMGIDEKIAKNFLETGDFDLIINIVDASNIERNLILTQQLIEKNLPIVAALNMLDVAERQGLHVKADELQRRLEIPVISIVASRRQGVDKLKQTLTEFLSSRQATEKTKAENANKKPVVDSAAIDLPGRYHKAQALLNGVIEFTPINQTLTEKIDRWVLNRYLGIPCFLLMMYLMFTVAINLGAVFIDFFDILFAAVFVDMTRWLLVEISAPTWLTILLADGLGGGIVLVSTFIPVIGFLYLCLSLLEDSGYMSRAAFVVDRLMAKIGLPGNAFVPLIVGFGCNVPAVMAARSLNRDSERLMTIAMAPFMSCGARLTVYALFASAFFPSNGQNIVFLLYLLGIALAVGTGWVFRRQLFPGEVSHSVQEMPAYHIPVVRNIFITTWFRLKTFVFRAGKTIVAVVVVLSMLNSIGVDGSFGNEDSKDSVLSVIGKSITPAFGPIGVEEDNWPATVGLFTGTFAKEAIVGTLDSLYSEAETATAAEIEANAIPDLLAATGEALTSVRDELMGLADTLTDPLGISIGDVSDQAAVAEDQGVNTSTLTNMASLFAGPFAAFCYLVFVLLYAPCVAVLGAITKEAGWRYMLIVFSWCTGLGYYVAALIYQAGTFTQHPLFSAIWIGVSSLVMIAAITALKSMGKRAISQPQLIDVVQV